MPDTLKTRRRQRWRNLKTKGFRRYHLQLLDEAPAIGSGHRYVWAKVGRKWAHLRTLWASQRITRAEFEACKPEDL